jgi:hypothetical protein
MTDTREAALAFMNKELTDALRDCLAQRDAFSAENAALKEQAVSVKELPWRGDSDIQSATILGSMWAVVFSKGKWELLFAQREGAFPPAISKHRTIEEAKAAAQTDFESHTLNNPCTRTVAEVREEAAKVADKRIELLEAEHGSYESDTNHTNYPEWVETACEELEGLAANIRALSEGEGQ